MPAFILFKRCLPCLGLLVAMLPVDAKETRTMIRLSGTPLSVNGQADIPSAMFGVHHMPLSSQSISELGIGSSRFIEQQPTGKPILPVATDKTVGANDAPPKGMAQILHCIFDRYQPALILHDPNWKATLTTLGETFGRNAQGIDIDWVMEFWNEPYLNWASRPGVNYDGFYYEQKDGKTFLRTTGEEVPHVSWTKEMKAVNRETGRVHYLASRYAYDYKRWGKYKDGAAWKPFEWKEGFEFHFRGAHCVMMEMPWLKDDTQISYYSAEWNRDLYSRMLGVFATAYKKANAKATLIAGWDFNMWESDWQPFRELYKPIIDTHWQHLDGIAEHHYGGDTRMITAEYELVWSYVKGTYGKSIKLYNTEAGGAADPEKPTYAPNTHGKAPIQSFTYCVRDITHLLALSPDKVGSRVYHHPQNDKGGLAALRFLKPLRGEILEVTNSVPGSWAVAARQGDTISMVIFNDQRHTRSIPVSLLSADVVVSATITRASGTDNTVVLSTEAFDVHQARVSVGPSEAVRFDFVLKPNTTFGASIARQQYVAKETLINVGHNKGGAFHVSLDDVHANATGARLRWAGPGFNAATTVIDINGTSVPLTSPLSAWITEVPIDVSLLKSGNNIIRLSDKDDAKVLALSLVLDTPAAK